MKFYLTANFDRPGEMMDAHSATFLVSDEIPSPMGANLSAFENEAQAQKAQDKFTGKLFTWEEIQKHLKHE
jgi:copper chaperone NosL